MHTQAVGGRRRRRTFTLRVVFSVVTVCAIGSAWCGQKLSNALRQEEAVRRLSAGGAWVWYSDSRGVYRDESSRDAQSTIDRLQVAVTREMFTTVTAASLHTDFLSCREAIWSAPRALHRYMTHPPCNWQEYRVTSKDFELLQALPDLKRVDAVYCQVDVEGLKFLRGLRHLEELSLDGNHRLGFSELTLIGELKGLRRLSIARTGSIGDSEVAALVGLSRLEYLCLNGTLVGDGAVSGIASLKHLKHLNLGYTSVTDSSAESLASLRNLEQLCLIKTAVTDRTLAELVALPRLATLSISESALSGSGFQYLEAMQSLKSLRISPIGRLREKEKLRTEFEKRRPDVRITW